MGASRSTSPQLGSLRRDPALHRRPAAQAAAASAFRQDQGAAVHRELGGFGGNGTLGPSQVVVVAGRGVVSRHVVGEAPADFRTRRRPPRPSQPTLRRHRSQHQGDRRMRQQVGRSHSREQHCVGNVVVVVCDVLGSTSVKDLKAQFGKLFFLQ